MFKNLLKELTELDGMEISVPVETDDEGYLDKECPNYDCRFQFKVHKEDWQNIFTDESVFCPLCKKESSPDNFMTTEQNKKIEKRVSKYISRKINNAMIADAKKFNRQHFKDSFITMRMKVHGRYVKNIILPISSKETFEQKIKCEICFSRYSVIGSAFFCPSCGHNSTEEMFNNTIYKIKSSIKNIPVIRKSINEISIDEAETTCQTIIEKCLSDCVTSFQRYCDVMYSKCNKSKRKISSNIFQRLDGGGELWRTIFNESYLDWLSESQYKRLNILFQRRHLLQHTEGIVDQKYLDKSNDSKYKIGQRIIVNEDDVLELVEIILVLIGNIKERLEL